MWPLEPPKSFHFFFSIRRMIWIPFPWTNIISPIKKWWEKETDPYPKVTLKLGFAKINEATRLVKKPI